MVKKISDVNLLNNNIGGYGQPSDYKGRHMEKVIENLKRQKKNESDLNQHLNIRSRNNKKGEQDPLTKFNGIKANANKQKMKKAHSVVNGSVSYLVNRGHSNNKICLTKDDGCDDPFVFKVPDTQTQEEQEQMELEELQTKKNEQKPLTKEERKKVAQGANNIQRLKTVQDLIDNNEDLINKLKLNYQILANWLNYVGYLTKGEFDSALKSIGVRFDPKLYNQLFMQFDINRDGVIDEKEFIVINNLFKGHTIDEKVKIFFGLCDQESEGYLDETKQKSLFKRNMLTDDKQLDIESKKVQKKTVIDFVDQVRPQKPSEIRIDEVLAATKNNIFLKNLIEKNIVKFDSGESQKKFSVSSFLHNQNLLAHEGTHHIYYDKFVSAIENKERIYQNSIKILKVFKDFEDNLPGVKNQNKN